MSNRAILKGFFGTGQRPTQGQFEDLIDSSVNLTEPNPTTTFNGGIVIGNVGVPATAGAIQWTGIRFEFHNGAGFQPLTFGGAAITNPLDIGNVRIGSTLTGGVAAFSHLSKYSDNDFGFGQTPAGATIVSSATSILFQNRVGGVPTNVLSITSNRATINTSLLIGVPSGPAVPGPAALIVYGEARKSDGIAWTTMSDVRVKKDISVFSEGLDKVMQINPVWFKYKNVEDSAGEQAEQVGILAHELQPVFPYMIKEVKAKISADDKEESDLLCFNGSALLFVVINAIKELNTRLQRLEATITKQHN